MSSSFYTALSGMRTHQQWIDVIGNNLANANTPGYKVARASFGDNLLRNLRFATGPETTRGGTNPTQIGLGVRFAGVDRMHHQGGLNATGRVFDLALTGQGFFALEDLSGARVYSRAGTFGVDSSLDLVDQRTGYRVLNALGQSVRVATDALFPPSATANVELAGNLPAVVTGPLAEVLTGNTGLAHGFPAMLTAATAGPSFAVPVSSTWTLEVVVDGGAPQLVTVTDTDADGLLLETDIAAALDAANDVSAVVGAGGFIEVTTDRTGSALSLQINAGTTNDLANLINLSTTPVSGSQNVVTALTNLNDLPANVLDYVAGDEIDVTGVDTDGTPINATFTYGVDGTTVNELIAFIDGLYTDAQVSLNASGQIVVEAQTPGEADLLLTIRDDTSNVGSTQWATYAVSVTTEGTGPDTVTTSSEVYDAAGVAHVVTLQFERQADSSWNVMASIPPSEGSVLVGGAGSPIQGLMFDSNGAPTGLGSVNGTLSILFSGQSAAQAVQLDFGTDGAYDGLTQFGSQASAHVRLQDGFGVGELANLTVDGSGTIEGFYTNGQSRSLGDVGVATFVNAEGLQDVGDNLWIETANSGTAFLGQGANLGAGEVVSGSIESSNVDMAAQFVELIQAQRGFQANARVITTQDEILAETVNLI